VLFPLTAVHEAWQHDRTPLRSAATHLIRHTLAWFFTGSVPATWDRRGGIASGRTWKKRRYYITDAAAWNVTSVREV